ncbi:MAG: hypothetical protein QXX08_02685 [Candidatus Bathyarchaeia archaeon]
MNGRGRPKKWHYGYRVSTLMIPFEYERFYKETIIQAQAEGKSHSEFILNLASEAWKLHYPGNPQTILPSHTGEAPLPIRLKAQWLMRDLEDDLKILREKQGSPLYRHDARKRVEKTVLDLSNLNVRLQDEKIAETIKMAVEILNRENGR